MPKQSETHLYRVGELLFVGVLIDFLKQIFTELRGRERCSVQINSMWRGKREDEEEGDMTKRKPYTRKQCICIKIANRLVIKLHTVRSREHQKMRLDNINIK